jgi:hypothetical protein
MKEKTKAYLISNIPRCLKSFRVSLSKMVESHDGAFWNTSYAIGCVCGSSIYQVLGYPIEDYNPKCKGNRMFISPLSTVCVSCGQQTELLNTDIHGYHGEIDASAKYTGSGPQAKHHCANCNCTDFDNLTVILAYDYNSLDKLDEGLKAEDYFRDFTLNGTCTQCKRSGLITSLDSL